MIKLVCWNEDERCEECGSDNVQTVHDSNGNSVDVCKDCGHTSVN